MIENWKSNIIWVWASGPNICMAGTNRNLQPKAISKREGKSIMRVSKTSNSLKWCEGIKEIKVLLDIFDTWDTQYGTFITRETVEMEVIISPKLYRQEKWQQFSTCFISLMEPGMISY